MFSRIWDIKLLCIVYGTGTSRNTINFTTLNLSSRHYQPVCLVSGYPRRVLPNMTWFLEYGFVDQWNLYDTARR